MLSVLSLTLHDESIQIIPQSVSIFLKHTFEPSFKGHLSLFSTTWCYAISFQKKKKKEKEKRVQTHDTQCFYEEKQNKSANPTWKPQWNIWVEVSLISRGKILLQKIINRPPLIRSPIIAKSKRNIQNFIIFYF